MITVVATHNKDKLGDVMKSKIILLLLTSSMLVGFTTSNQKIKTNDIKQVDSVEILNLRSYKVDQVEGIMKVEYEKIKEIERKKEEERIKLEELNRKIEIESKKQYWKFEVSFYDSCYDCTQNGDGQTASGEYVQEGVTIALPKDIPFGSEVHIEGTGDYIVQDRGGYIEYTYDNEGNLVMRVDVYVDSHSKALELGRYYAEGYIIIKE